MPIPLIIAAVAGASVVATGINRLRQKKLNVSIIGPTAAGKNVLIDVLRDGKAPESDEYQGSVGMSKLEEFEAYWTKKNTFCGTFITVNSLDENKLSSPALQALKNLFPDWIVKSSGYDIAGDSAYVEIYRELVKDRDAVFFVFDVYKYLSDKDYENNVKAELMLIYKNTNNGKDVNLIMLGSHADVVRAKLKLATEKMVSDKFLNTLTGKSYRSMCVKNIRFLNFLDSKSVEEIRKSLGSLGE